VRVRISVRCRSASLRWEGDAREGDEATAEAADAILKEGCSSLESGGLPLLYTLVTEIKHSTPPLSPEREIVVELREEKYEQDVKQPPKDLRNGGGGTCAEGGRGNGD